MNLIRNCFGQLNTKKKDSGSTLITVIVAVAFVTILTTIILSTSSVNYKMKTIDRGTRDDFYYAEKVLNDVYAGVGQKSAKLAGKAYSDAFKKVGTTDTTGTTYDRAKVSRDEFKKKFFEDVYDEYSTNTLDTLKDYVVPVNIARIDDVDVIAADAIQYRYTDGTKGTVYKSKFVDPAETLETKDLIITNVTVESKDKGGYRSVIKTDIIIEVPTLDFFGVNADVTEYGIIACQGVYINGGCTVNGNVYAGIHPTANSADTAAGAKRLYGGINVLGGTANMKGNYIVSKGDINISGTGTKFVVENASLGSANLPNLWFDTLRTVKGSSNPEVRIKANSFVLNDLELNGDGGQVKIGGNYYGYSDRTAVASIDDTNKHDNSISIAAELSADDNSSAIIINGRKNSLDMKDIETFVLMGKAYVDFTTKSSTFTGAEKEVETAEGVALKTNQQLYIVPNDFMSCPNPADDDHYTEERYYTIYNPDGTTSMSTSTKHGFYIDVNPDTVRNWFGYEFVKDPSDDVDKIFKEYVVNGIHYAYLNFNDLVWKIDENRELDGTITYTYTQRPVSIGQEGTVSSKTAFLHKVMTAMSPAADEDVQVQPSAFRLNSRVRSSITRDAGYGFALSECIIGDKSHNSVSDPDGAVIYARNAVVSYAQPTGSEIGIQPTVMVNKVGMERYFNYSQNLLHRYQLLCGGLNGCENVSLDVDPFTSVSTAESDVAKAIWSDAVTTKPLDNFILLSSVTGDTSSVVDADLPETAYGKCIIKSGDVTISPNVGTTFKGIAIVDGNITVPASVNVTGLLMATGTITIEGGNSTINADKGLLQSRVEKEISLVEASTLPKSSAYKSHYLISYLTSDGASLMYDIEPAVKKPEDYISADYNDFMHYENWQKGE